LDEANVMERDGGGLSHFLGQGLRRGRTCRHLGSGTPHVRSRDLLRYNLKTVRAYLLKETFQQLWEYNSPSWAGKFLGEWCRQTMRSRIEPMKKIARSLRQHRELILNYFRAQKLISSGVVEGLNNKAKVTMRKSYGFRTYQVLELALYHSLGKLPEPESTHVSSEESKLIAPGHMPGRYGRFADREYVSSGRMSLHSATSSLYARPTGRILRSKS
jgi:transposase